LIAFGGWLAFMAKPTTAAALSVWVLLYLGLTGKLNLRMLVVCAATGAALMVMTAWMIDGSLTAFIQHLVQASHEEASIENNHTLWGILRFDSFRLNDLQQTMFAAFALSVFIGIWLSLSDHPLLRIAGMVVAMTGCAMSVLLTTGMITPHVRHGSFDILPALGVPIGLLLGWVARQITNLRYAIAWGDVWLAAFLLVLPHVCAFGTNGNYWSAGGKASLFWILAAVALLPRFDAAERLPRAVLPAAVAMLVLATFIVKQSMAFPYRQTQPLWQQDARITFVATGEKLRVSRDFADYLLDLQRIVSTNGFQLGTPFIDLTGHNPGTLNFIGAPSLAAAWLIGGYAGSATRAGMLLDKVSCDEIARSWVLTEPNGPRRLSPAILEPHGIDLEAHYIPVGTIQQAANGNYPTRFRQVVLKPSRPQSDAAAACEATRSRKPLP
jgi:hypothetical protein